MSCKLFVGNLPYSVTSERLQEAFSQFGTVTSSKVIVDRETGRSRGFAFLEMETDDQGAAAMQAMNGALLDGRSIAVREAVERQPGGGGGGGSVAVVAAAMAAASVRAVRVRPMAAAAVVASRRWRRLRRRRRWRWLSRRRWWWRLRRRWRRRWLPRRALRSAAAVRRWRPDARPARRFLRRSSAGGGGFDRRRRRRSHPAAAASRRRCARPAAART